MIDFSYRPQTYFDGTGPSTLLVKLTYSESQWGEEISIFANVMDGIFYYEAVDFYGNEFQLNPEKSSSPLDLQELIFLIESMDVKPGVGMGNIELTLMGIPEVESNLYPELSIYFDEKRKNFGLH